MDIRHPACKLIASVLSGLLVLNPLVAAAAELAVDAAAGGNTSIGAAGNGVPIVNIATPNGAGLSHNRFTDYNVGQNGLILNNATDKTQSTQLGGMIIGNPNLKGGAAQKILNEVTGANPSQLRGYTEVAGQSAHVIVANPHGITCNGCGFINTPRATLTTGKPVVENGQLRGYDVNGGEISIDGKGLNASNVDRFELITRATKLNADLHANQLTVVAGRNQVDAETLAATAKADDGSAKPQLAIDSSALGGMYAGAIRLVGTEQGVGVKLAGNMAASAGDIQIDANGQLSVAQASASGSLRARAQTVAINGPAYAAGTVELSANGQLSNQGQTAAGSRLQVQAGQVDNSGILEAGVNPDNSRNAHGDVAISAPVVRNSGSVVASRGLDINASGSLDNQRGASLRGASTTINATALSNQGRVLASSQLGLSGQYMSNLDGEMSAQLIQVQGGYLDNRQGLFSATQALSLVLGNLDNSQHGTLSSQGTLAAQVSGALNNSQGGRLLSEGAQQLRAGQLYNQAGGLISSRGDLAVQAEAQDNRGGTFVSDAGLQLSGIGLDNRDQGRISAGRDLQLSFDSLSNAGVIRSDAALRLNAGTVSNASGGQIAAKGPLNAQVGSLIQTGGELLSETYLQVLARQIYNQQGGRLGALQGIDLQADALFNQGGELSSQGALTLRAASIDNSAGRVASAGLLHWQGDSWVNRAGTVAGQGLVTFTGGLLDNSQGGAISSQQGLSLDLARQLDNRAGGKLLSEGALNLRAAQVDNRAGTLSSAGAVSVTSTTLNNQGGQLVTDSTLNVAAQNLDNRQGGVISAKGTLALGGTTLLNSQSGRILAGADLLLTQALVDNSGKGRLEAAGRVIGQLGSLDQHDAGQLLSTGGIDLDFAGGSLDNSAAGLLATPGQLLLRNLAQLNNSAGGEVSSQQGFALQLATLNNQGGKVLSEGALNLSAQSLDNRQGGWIGAMRGIEVRANQLLNQGGEINSRASVSLDTEQLDNSAGLIASDEQLQWRGDSLANRAGTLRGQGGLSVTGRHLDNSQGGQMSSLGDLDLNLTEQLDNHAGGQLTSEGVLSLDAARIDNRAGVLSSGGALRITGSTLNNQGGKLLTDATLSVTAQTLDNRQSGVISAKGALALRGATLLNSQSGRILGGAELLLAQTRVDNSDQGRIEAAGRVSGQLQTLDQHAGGRLVSSTGIDLDFAGGRLDNSAGGLLATSGALQLRNLAQLNNSSGGEISSQQSYLLSLAELNNQGGRILSSDGLTLQVRGTVDNSQSGVLFGHQKLQLDALDLNNSQGGTVASQGAIQARLQGQLDNHADGALAAGGHLSVSSASLNNQSGSLSAGQDLSLLTGATDNQLGRITAQASLDARTADLDNRGGILSGQQSQRLQAQAIDNRAGLITSQGGLELTASRVDNGQGGELSAGGALQLHVQQLIQQQGRLITGGDLNLDMAGGDLDNRGAVLSVGGLLRIDNLRHLDNRGGEISSQNSFQLSAASLDNGDAGRLISAQQLTLNTGALRNANQGLLSGWQGLIVNAADLDNSGGGTLSSKLGTLELSLSGALDNHGEGALVSLGDQRLRAAQLNNAGGILSTQGNLDLALAGLLDNSAGGLISAQQHLALNLAQSDLLNQSGQISAASLDLNARHLLNSGGLLLSQGALHGTLSGTLINTNNARLASAGELLLSAASLDNRGGQLASQQRLELTAGSLDNSLRGTVASQHDLTLNLGQGTLDNHADGLLHSASGALVVSAGNLNNQGGTLDSLGDARLLLSGLLDNRQQGRIQSGGGQLLLQSANLDNSAGGILHSATSLLRLLTGSFNNNAGITQAQQLDITAYGGIDNRGGHLSAVSGDSRITTADLNNQGGGLYAGNLLYLRGNQLLNDGAVLGEGGRIGAGDMDFGLAGALNNRFGLIESGGSLDLTAQSLDNVVGSVRSLGQSGVTRITLADLLDNRLGRVESAASDFSLHTGALQNGMGSVLHVGSGRFDIDLAQAGLAGGSFVSNGVLTYQATQWTNHASIQARQLDLNIGQLTQTASGQLLASQALTGRGDSWNNQGLLASDGWLDIQLGGTYTGSGRVTSLGNLNLSAGQIDLPGSITGGATVSLGANTLNNHGRITAAGDLTASTGSLNNFGTLGSAGQLRINTGDLLNDGQQNGALIFSGDDMTLRVGGTLTNRFADIYSLGGLDLAGDDAGTRSVRLDNLSASLESLGDMQLKVGTLNNQRVVLVVDNAGKYTAQIIEVSCFKYFNDDTADCSGSKRNGVWEVTERDKLDVLQASAASSISSAGNLRIEAEQLNNRSSQIATGQNLYASVGTLTNEGVVTGELETFKVYRSPRAKDLSAWQQEAKAFTDRYWYESPGYVLDPQGLATALAHFISLTHLEYTPAERQTRLEDGDQTYAAIIQAGGDIAIDARDRLDNSVIRNHYTYVSPGQKTGDTAVGDSSVSTVVAIDAYLPPDLAQQQVNPITLPGFSLPTGSNGLFRLSGQEGTQSSAEAVTAGGSYSFAGQSISLSQRERSLDASTGLSADLQRSDATAATAVQHNASIAAGPGSVQLGNTASAQEAAAGASLSVAQVQGVPSTARPDNSHKYLIETNPELTSLKSFLSSDYLLGLLGYDPDKSQKRLGDGLYEQRLIRDAVVARTGQRYINGLASDEDLFRYLMDNAIAYQDKVHLSLGVALSAEQVAALTHDIVWLEEAQVNGEKVLVPVLYLAQADNRLGPNGALIQGQNLSLISGGDLANQGTLRASGDLAASAANLSNSGLIEAAGRLDLLALDSIKNTQGGIIKGRDVSLSALTGDVLNERSITRIDSAQGDNTWTRSFADSAARIEAAGRLDISAGRDINNLGGAISSGSDLSMQAGRDINLHSVELENGTTRGRNYDQSTTQLGSDISAGRDLQISAGRDASAIASHLDAGRDIAINAGRDVTLASAADEQHSYSQSKKVTAQEDRVQQQSTTVTAGGDVLIAAGQDLTLISSKVSAGNEAYLVAGDKIQVLAANDSDYSLYDKKEKGSWGSKKTQHDEVTDVKAVSSEISAGGDITLLSGGDQKYQAAKLDSGGDIALVSGGSVTFEAVKDLHQEAHDKSDSDQLWNSSKGKGSTDETVRQTQMTAQGEILIKAVDGLHIDLKQIDQKNVSQTIDAMVKADPQLAWIKDAEARGDVDWRLVQELHDSYSYNNQSLGAGPSLIISIVAAAYLGPVYGAMASNLAIGTINNGGDIGKGLQQATSADALKGYAITAATAYVVNPYLDGQFSAHTDPTYNVTKGFNLSTWGMDGVGGFAAYSLAEGFAQSVMQQAAYGGKFVDNLGDAMGAQGSGLAMALGFNAVGDWAQGQYDPGSPQKVVAHALMGGILAEATGSDFKTGAMAAGVNEAMANLLSQWAKNDPKYELMESQVVGVLAAMVVDGDVSKGAEIAKNATAYNSQDHDHDGKIDYSEQLREIKRQMGIPESPMDAIEHGNPIPILPDTTTTSGSFAAGIMGRIFGGGGKYAAAVPKGAATVQNLTERGTLVNLRPNDVAIAQRPVRTLVQDESGRYWLQSSTGNKITPSGSYDFVTMPNGVIRVSRPNVNQDFSTHLGLSGGGEVKYAGSIRFGNNDGPSRGVITQWSNNSGHYQPPATLSGNAGLPVNLFNPK